MAEQAPVLTVAERALTVVCPLCAAKPDEPCRGPNGRLCRTHSARRRSARGDTIPKRLREHPPQPFIPRTRDIDRSPHLIYRVVSERRSPDGRQWWVAARVSKNGSPTVLVGVELAYERRGDELALRRAVDAGYRNMKGLS